jgi:hypothetical protein
MVLAGAAAALVLAGLAGCGSGSSTPPPSRGSPTGPPSSAPGGAAPTVSVVPQPADGKAGPVVAVEGTVRWVVPGLPNCAELTTSHQPPQELSLVGATADQLRHAAEAGRGQTRAQVRITGYVPPAAATVCGGLSFSVTQVSPVTG